MNQDTICAIATANGVGALGIIRLSGAEAVKIAQKTFKGTDLETVKSHTVHYGYIVDGKKQEARSEKQEKREKSKEDRPEMEEDEEFNIQNSKSNIQNSESSITQLPIAIGTTSNTTEELIDEVMVSVFRAPKTFTTVFILVILQNQYNH
jgi:tRNA modification GTPase